MDLYACVRAIKREEGISCREQSRLINGAQRRYRTDRLGEKCRGAIRPLYNEIARKERILVEGEMKLGVIDPHPCNPVRRSNLRTGTIFVENPPKVKLRNIDSLGRGSALLPGVGSLRRRTTFATGASLPALES